MGRRREGGFTIIELMLVAAIIGLLAAIALPKFANMIRKSKEAVILGHLGTLRSAMTLYYADNEGLYPRGWASAGAPPYFTDRLVPKYLKAIPMVSIPHGHDRVPQETYTTGFADDMSSYSGDCLWFTPIQFLGWIPGPTWELTGDVRVNCDHTDVKGRTWSTY